MKKYYKFTLLFFGLIWRDFHGVRINIVNAWKVAGIVWLDWYPS